MIKTLRSTIEVLARLFVVQSYARHRCGRSFLAISEVSVGVGTECCGESLVSSQAAGGRDSRRK